MKRKILTIIMIIVMITILGTINSFATGNIELNVQGETTVKDIEKTIELTLSLGSFTEIEEGIPLGYQGTLEYDENLFEGITVEGLNGWTVNYENSTKVFMGETDTAKANTQIAKITLTLKDGVTPGTSGTINFNDILLTDGTNDFTFNKEITVTIENEEEDNPNQGTGNEEENQVSGGNESNKVNNPTSTNISTNSTSIQGSNTDKTTASTRLPSAGLKNILIIAVVIISILMVVFKVKSRDIKY